MYFIGAKYRFWKELDSRRDTKNFHQRIRKQNNAYSIFYCNRNRKKLTRIEFLLLILFLLEFFNKSKY